MLARTPVWKSRKLRVQPFEDRYEHCALKLEELVGSLEDENGRCISDDDVSLQERYDIVNKVLLIIDQSNRMTCLLAASIHLI